MVYKNISSVSIFYLALLGMPFLAYAEGQEKIQESTGAIIVTANPFQKAQSELSHPVTVMTDQEIIKNSGTTLGDILSNAPGIRSSNFGPTISRPVIRGLSGDQINILQNGINNLDASATSADHNVTIDPLSIEQVEVLRGPAALFYGTKAIGGVVNIIDNRIPTETIGAPLTGIIDTRFNSVNEERSGSVLLEGGNDEFAWHLHGFQRRSDEVRIPGFARSERLRNAEPLDDPDEEESRNRLENSQSETKGVTLGLSKIFDKGYFGLAWSHYNSNYGVIGHEHHHEEEEHGDHDEEEEENVLLDIHQNRLDFAGQYRNPFAHIEDITYKIGLSDYEHQEFENAEAGTLFKNKGFDSRIVLNHTPIAQFRGSFGLQHIRSDFIAEGEEAFVPGTLTQNFAGFFLEERQFGDLNFNFGGRLDYQHIDKKGSNNFGASQVRDALTHSASVGMLYNFSHDYKISASFAHTQRAPNAQELFANGAHIATRTFEVGNANLDTEKSTSIDLSVRKTKGKFTGEVNLFYTYFEDFIALSPTGLEDTQSEAPIFNYENLPAEFVGIEFKTNFNLYDAGLHHLSMGIDGDYLHARNRKTNANLPRIAPARIGHHLRYGYDAFSAQLDTVYNFKQTETAPQEFSTDDFTMLNFGIDYQIAMAQTDTTVYLQATNILDQEARNHVSFLKDRAPLAGRSFMVGLRHAF